MTLEIKIFETIGGKSWDEKLAENLGSTAYQTTSFLAVYQQSFDSKPYYILVKKNNETVAQLSVIIHTNQYWSNANTISNIVGRKLKLGTILRWEYGPMVYDQSDNDGIMSKILEVVDHIALQNHVMMIRGTTNPFGTPPKPEIFKKYGYDDMPWATYVTNLDKQESDLYAKLDKETKYDIRKSEKNGLQFEVAGDFSSFKEYADLSIKIKKLRKEAVKAQDLLTEKLWNLLYDKGILRVFLAKKDGKLLAGIDALAFNKHIVQYGVVNSPEGQKLQAGSFLTWNAIKWSIKNGYQMYDMGGINPVPKTEKERSINFYKSKWGGNELPYVRYVKVLSDFKLKASSILNDPKKVTKIVRHMGIKHR